MTPAKFNFGCRLLLAVQLAGVIIVSPSAAENKVVAAGKDETEQRIQRVTNGLLPAIDTDGQASATELILHQDGKDRVGKRVP
jgi:hypothetical protein